MKTHVDGDDYTTYPLPKEPLRKFDIAPPPSRAQTEIDDLKQRVRHLEKIVHMMLNPEGE